MTDLALISTMDRPMLEQAWQAHLPKIPIPKLNLRTLRSALAYEIQIKETGDISKKTARVLRGFLPHISCSGEKTGGAQVQSKVCAKKPSTAKPPLLTKGTVLVREWNGRRYQVEVLDGVFQMDGRVYASLSKIAKSITGTDWSGPRFFGLTKAPPPLPGKSPALAEAHEIESTA